MMLLLWRGGCGGMGQLAGQRPVLDRTVVAV